MSHEKNTGWLGYRGDEILPSYMGIIIFKPLFSDPVIKQPVFHGMSRVGFGSRCSIGFFPQAPTS